MLKSAQLRDQAKRELDAAKAIAEKAEAESRDMSGEEAGEFRKHYDAAVQLTEQYKAALNDEQVVQAAKSLADELGLGVGAVDDLDAQTQVPAGRPAGKSLGRTVVESAQYKALMGQFAGGRVPEKARVESQPIPVKALITGNGGDTGAIFVQPDRLGILDNLGRVPLTVRDLVSVRQTGSDAIEYVVQTGLTNAAAPVPEATTAAAGAAVGPGGYKPEGGWTYARRTTNVITIAEWIPATKRALADVAQLEGLINDELVADLAEAEEMQLLSGTGTGENLTGILNTSGVGAYTAAAGEDLFVSLRRGISNVRIAGRVAPNGILMNPADTERIDLARADGTTGVFLGGGPFGPAQRTVWGVPVVESENIDAGTALLGDFTKAVLWDRQQATVSVTDSHADFFVRNLVAILAEERLAFAVTRPSAFSIVTL